MWSRRIATNSKRLAVACIGGSTVVAWSNDAFAAASPTKPAAGQVTPGVGQQLSSAVVPHRYLPDYGKYHPNLVVVDSRALKALFTILRDESTIHLDFAAAADRLMRILAEEGLAQRAGDTLLEAVRRIQPGVAVGKVLIQRDETDPDKRPKLFYVKLPADIATRTILLVDPMLATGQSATLAIDVLLQKGVKQEQIVFLNVVSCPEGLSILASRYPKVKVVTAAVDEGLNQDKYIVPGLGDFGDRYFGTDISVTGPDSSANPRGRGGA